MALYTAWDSIFNAVTAGVLALFGVWVLTLRPRSRTSTFLGLFAVIHGFRFVVSNLWDVSDLLRYYGERGIDDPWQVNLPELLMEAASAAALFGLAHAILLPEGREGRTAWRVMVGVVPVLSILTLMLYAGRIEVVLLPVGWPLRWASLIAAFAFYYAFASIPLIFAWLYRRAVRAGGAGARQDITLSVAFVLWPALIGAFGLFSVFGRNDIEWINLGVLVLVMPTGLLWLANIRLDQGLAKACRNAALLTFALILFGAIDMVFLWDVFGYSGSRGPFFGLARLATVVVLAYAILHNQVLGMDVKFRFAISKGTVAAIILAIVFVASEGAQALFGADKQWLGLVAGGFVVFAIAPLQRAADRLAEKAVPSAAPAMPAAAVASSDGIFLNALRVALRDKALTRDEELHLHRLAAQLGIDAGRAHELLIQAERERSRKPRGKA